MKIFYTLGLFTVVMFLLFYGWSMFFDCFVPAGPLQGFLCLFAYGLSATYISNKTDEFLSQ